MRQMAAIRHVLPHNYALRGPDPITPGYYPITLAQMRSGFI